MTTRRKVITLQARPAASVANDPEQHRPCRNEAATFRLALKPTQRGREVRRDRKELAQRVARRLHRDRRTIRVNAYKAAHGGGAAVQPDRDADENGRRRDARCRLAPSFPDRNRGVGKLVSALRRPGSRQQPLVEGHPVRNLRVDLDDGPPNANGRGRAFRHDAGHHCARGDAHSPPDLWRDTGRYLWTGASRSAAALSADASVLVLDEWARAWGWLMRCRVHWGRHLKKKTRRGPCGTAGSDYLGLGRR